MYLGFYNNLEVMKNTTFIEKCLEFDAVTYILTFTKEYFSLYYETKSCFAKKKKSDFGVGGGGVHLCIGILY